MKQGEAKLNDAFKLCFDNVYETMELVSGEIILWREHITKNGSQSSDKEQQPQIDQMQAMCFLLSVDKKVQFPFKTA